MLSLAPQVQHLFSGSIYTLLVYMKGMLDFRRLRYFVEVANRLHFSEAAKALGISQQPLSRAIAQLEDELDTVLFARTTRKVSLTAAGEALRDKGLVALQYLALAERAARSEGRTSLKVVYPGVHDGVPHTAVARFKEMHPEVRVTTSMVPSSEQERVVVRAEADIGFVVPPSKEKQLAWRTVLRVPMMVAMPSGHLLRRKRRLSLKDFQQERWISYSRQKKPSLDAFVRGQCLAAGFVPRRGQEVGSEAEALVCVSEGLGIAMVNAKMKHGPEVVLRNLFEAPCIEIAAIWRLTDERPELHALLKSVALTAGVRLG